MRKIVSLGFCLCLLTAAPVTANDPNLPDWAQTPSTTQRSTTPPHEAAAPGLPGPPSMPIGGLALLALAGGALAFRKLRSEN